MRTEALILALLLPLFLFGQAWAEEETNPLPDTDALAVKPPDGSASLRAKKKLTKMERNAVQLQVLALDDSKFPLCTFTAKVLVAAESKDKHLGLMARGKAYNFAPVLKLKDKLPDLTNKMNQNNLGACYYLPGTKLEVKVSGVDLKAKMFKAEAIYPKP
jgi:hypothetical protein